MTKKSIIVAMLLIFSCIVIVEADDEPQADFTWTPPSPFTNELVQFTDLSTPQTSIVERMWYFGDGGGSTQKNPTHRYEEPGTYTVELLVIWNISGNFTYDTAEYQITVKNQPPIADAGEDRVVNTSNVAFDGSGSFDPDGTITSYEWDFGDGTTGVGMVVQHTYTNDGNYTVTLNVTDDFGGYDEDTAKITVDTHPPETEINLTGTKGDDEWFTSNVTVKLTATDGLSGVKRTLYRINGTWMLYTQQFIVDNEGENLLLYYSEDNAGNVEEEKNKTIKIDKTKPTVSITNPVEKKLYIFGRGILPTFRKTVIIGKITVEVNATDNIGVKIVKFYLDGDEKANSTDSPYTWKLGGEIGNRNITVKAFDEAGLMKRDYINVLIISLFKPRDGSIGEGTTTIDKS